MKTSWIAAAGLSVLLLAGCGGSGTSVNATSATSATKGATLSPEELGELGAEIRKEPSKADEVLKKHGLDAKSFERQIRKVSEDPDASQRYAEAYRKARA
ncbi:MAG: hypothetical protein WBX15_05070 [Thermoanaerobaculia bacterium]